MSLCTAKDCHRRGQSLPEEEFRGDGRMYKQCSDCRSRQLAYKQHGKKGVNSKGFKLRETPIGDAPKFMAEGHREMWQEWLRELVGQVERTK